ncbi:MAG: glycoside hydrolase family 32 protein [Culicoidibacterales bacterium]
MAVVFETAAALTHTMIDEPNRLKFHIQPPVGLLNDPNGLVQHHGVFHVFYQWNPWSCEHKNKTWNHLTTTNFIDFQQQDVALLPTDWYDKNGCYSGSAFIKDDHVHLFYTGNVKDEAGNRQAYQCLARVQADQSVEKLGVVIDDCEIPEGYTRHFRDPKIWFDQETQQWITILGAQTCQEQGTVLLFTSRDAMKWAFHGELQTKYTRQFGYMWECPDLLTVDNQDVLIFSPQGVEQQGMEYANIYQSGYLLGSFDLPTARLQHGTFRELDRGFEFYAPQTFTDESGRVILLAWMGLPEEEAQPTCEAGWVHALTVPRHLTIRDGILCQQPIRELQALRKTALQEQVLPSGHSEHTVSDCYELQLTWDTLPTTGTCTLSFDHEHTLELDFNQKLATLRRTGAYLPGIRQCQLEETTNLTLTILKDTSSVEIFLQDGRNVFTARTFHEHRPTILTVELAAIAATIAYCELGAMTITHTEKGKK